MPRNSLANGKPAPDSFNNQLDEDSYPLIMALAVGLTGKDYYPDHIAPAANFVAAHGPIGGPERWEEQDGYSPSTIVGRDRRPAGRRARSPTRNRDRASAAVWRGVADEFQRNLKKWTLTTNGPLPTKPYFIRLSKTGDPNAAITYNVGNGGPTLDQRAVIDAGFLEYARLGIFRPTDPDIVTRSPVVDKTIAHDTASGEGFLRYNGDGYGDVAPTRRPPVGAVRTRARPRVAGAGGRARRVRAQPRADAAAVGRLQTMRNMARGVGLIPEQAWDVPDLAPTPFGTDPTNSSIGFINGKPAGSAAALTWSAGAVRAADARRRRRRKVLDRPDYTVNRYITHTQGTTRADRHRAGRPLGGRPARSPSPARPRRATRSASRRQPGRPHARSPRTATAGTDGVVHRPAPADRRHDRDQHRGHDKQRRHGA